MQSCVDSKLSELASIDQASLINDIAVSDRIESEHDPKNY